MDTVEPFGEGVQIMTSVMYMYILSTLGLLICFPPKWNKKISKDQAAAVYSRTLYGRGSGPGCLKRNFNLRVALKCYSPIEN